MNKQLLKKVRKAIAKEETRFDQSVWWKDDDGGNAGWLVEIIDRNKQNPGGNGLCYSFCGTPRCIAGHAIHEFGLENLAKEPFHNTTGLGDVAKSILGLTPEEAEEMFRTDAVWDNTHGTGRRGPTRQEALEMLDTAIEYGRVEWPKGNEQ